MLFVIQFASVQIGRQTQLSLVDGCPAQVPVTDMRPLRGRCGKRLFQMLEVLISVCCHLFFFNLWYLVDVCPAQWDCVCIKMRPLRVVVVDACVAEVPV